MGFEQSCSLPEQLPHRRVLKRCFECFQHQVHVPLSLISATPLALKELLLVYTQGGKIRLFHHPTTPWGKHCKPPKDSFPLSRAPAGRSLPSPCSCSANPGQETPNIPPLVKRRRLNSLCSHDITMKNIVQLSVHKPLPLQQHWVSFPSMAWLGQGWTLCLWNTQFPLSSCTELTQHSQDLDTAPATLIYQTLLPSPLLENVRFSADSHSSSNLLQSKEESKPFKRFPKALSLLPPPASPEKEALPCRSHSLTLWDP